MPIYEPGLEELVERNMFTTSYAEAMKEAKFAFIFIAVGTPEGVDGVADLRYVRRPGPGAGGDAAASPH